MMLDHVVLCIYCYCLSMHAWEAVMNACTTKQSQNNNTMYTLRCLANHLEIQKAATGGGHGYRSARIYYQHH